MLDKIVQQLWTASEHKRMCRIILNGEPLPRVVHPYGVCKTSLGKIVLVCWQDGGFTKAGGKAGYRNLLLDRIISVEELKQAFRRKEDFNPYDSQYEEWIYHI